MRAKSILLFLSALIFLFLLQSAADETGLTRKNFEEFEKLQKIAGEQGNINVIIKIKVPQIKQLTAASTRHRTVLPGKQDEWGGAAADRKLTKAIARAADDVLYSLGGSDYQLNHTYPFIPYMALKVSQEALAILESLPEVLYIQEDKPVKLPLPVKDGGKKAKSTNSISTPSLDNTVDVIGASNTWSMGYDGSAWYVAVLDTGIRSSHEFFASTTILEMCYSLGEDGASGAGDCPDGNAIMSGTGSAAHHPNTYAGWDHGTHVSGIAVGNNGTLFGVARNAELYAVQVFSRFTDCDSVAPGNQPCVASWDSDSLAGLNYIYGQRGMYSIASVNMSLGAGSYTSACDTDPRKAAIDNLIAVDVATAIATGNDGYCGAVSAPACISSAVAVGSSTDADAESFFNNWHATMQTLFAPGSDVYSSTADSDTSYGSKSGTSMATPHVAGAWALLKHAFPTKGVAELLTALENTGVDIYSVCDGYTTPIPRIQIDDAINSFASITVTSPNGGENWDPGTVENITWDDPGISVLLKITLWKDGVLVGLIADDVEPAPGGGTYPWTVGEYIGGTAVPGPGYTVKVKAKGQPHSDTSDAAFSISSMVLTSPNGFENWIAGSNQNITWNAPGVTNTVKLTLWQGGGYVGDIADGLDPAAGSYTWSTGQYVGGTAAPGGDYKVKIEENGTAVSDDSDNPFNITTGGTITVTSPNGGETWQAGTPHDITWSVVGITGPVKITLWKDGLLVGTIADSLEPEASPFPWTTGQLTSGTAAPGTGYTVKIKQKGAPVSDVSDAAFEITPGTITVISPNGGETWPSGFSKDIEWNAPGIAGNLKITLWKDGLSVGLIADGLDPAAGSYSWTVGQYSGGTAPNGTGYTIKIKQQGAPVSDESNAAFTIESAPPITVTSPNGGESWEIGSSQTITWEAPGVSGLLRISLYKDGVQVGTIANNVDPTLGSIHWRAGESTAGTAPAGTGYKIKIKEKDVHVSDYSDAPFTLTEPSSPVIDPGKVNKKDNK